MDKSLIVAVFVPTTDAARTDHKGCEGTIATGYPVAPDLVLTARHLFHPESPVLRDPRYPVKVRWHYHRQHPDADSQGWIPLAPDEDAMVWRGTADLDAVLLRCPRPQGALGWGIVSEEPPTDDMPWVSEGFPRATVYDALRDPCAFAGKCFSKAPGEYYFELDARAPPEAEEDWRGASGMPIFVGRRILGVAQRVPKKFGSERLHATPCRKLLADQRFRDALGFDDWQGRLDQVQSELAGVLTPAAAAALAAALGITADLAGHKPPEHTARVAQQLLETDIRRAITDLRSCP